MTQFFASLLIVVLQFGLLAHAQQPAPSPILVFTHVTVIDVTGAPARPDMTVVMTEGRIRAIGTTSEIPLSPEAQVVNATGKFVIPGLWDMHVHWYLKDYLPLFIANGVTGVRLMWGVPMHHAWRTEIEQGTLLGPRAIVMPCTAFGGYVPAATIARVRQAITTLPRRD